jgi:N-acyl-D-amino-acid deacylase
MAHEIVVKGGTVADRTGAKPILADLAIDDGRKTIDVHGLIVSPGLIDLHPHLDAQIGWHPDLTSVSWDGVITAMHAGQVIRHGKERSR